MRALDLDLPETARRDWVKRADIDAGSGPPEADHAEAAANLYSLIASCKLHGIDPERYLAE